MVEALPAGVVRLTIPRGAFRYRAGQYVFLMAPALGVFEWSVELWRDVHLENTLDFYSTMDLRNQLARGSAWGFFVTALPEVSAPAASASGGGQQVTRLPSLSIKANALNPTTKSTPELVVGGERLGGRRERRR